ncbi:endonuclease [uncultured Dokdonia sp.]|uniref:endonuclease n=1 Tax=uncultured Dokdonia sp. TaxID=575653 RepID=UPI0026246721|nr:endonuclease [uncultured Dokdonia sp.]
MKKLVLLFITICITSLNAQQPYYDDVDLTLTGQDLYWELQLKLSSFNEDYNYGDVRDSFLITDLDPTNSNDVLLVYGFNDTDGDCTTDRTRDKDNFGGDNCEYNREHVFPRSRSVPPMGDAVNSATGIVADPHNLRPSDVQRNGNRGSKRFDDGSGNSGDVNSGNWYPGDEWKGDVARIIMYMYVRYGEQCLPEFTGIGPTEDGTDMLQVFLDWNVEDPVSAVEDQRNPQLEIEYGSRNPFIDNPSFATLIWGGTPAEDRFDLLSTDSFETTVVTIYPNPATNVVTITATQVLQDIRLYDLTGKVVLEIPSDMTTTKTIETSNLSSGIYLMRMQNNVQKLIIK